MVGVAAFEGREEEATAAGVLGLMTILGTESITRTSWASHVPEDILYK